MVRRPWEKRPQYETLNLIDRIGREKEREGEEAKGEKEQEEEREIKEKQEPERDEKEKEVGELEREETATVNCKMLDCYMCSEPLLPPLFQCSSGHAVCMLCVEMQLINTCDICFRTIEQIHNIPLEKILETSRVFCPNKKYGCEALIPYYKKHEHKTTCIFFPCFCPEESCKFSSSAREMKDHLITEHGCSVHSFSYRCATEFKVQISEQSMYKLLVVEDGCMFNLATRMERIGMTLCVICVRPPGTTGTDELKFWYDLGVYDNEEYFGMKIVFFSASVSGSTVEQHGEDSKAFVLVSDDHLQVLSSGSLILRICIKPVDQSLPVSSLIKS